MRPKVFASGFVGILVVAAGAFAQTPPAPPPAPAALTEMTIMVDQVEVRSGASKDYYATSKLLRGTKVQVVEQKFPGWLSIKPPPLSFSWISAQYVQRDAANKNIGIVKGGDSNDPIAPVLAGSSLTNQKPSVEVAKLKRGTALVILGEPLNADGGSWFPIQPTEQEVRYLPASAVQGSPSTPVAGRPAPAVGGQTAIAMAEKAYTDRDWQRARQLYEEAANQTTDYQTKSYCYSRLAQIENNLRSVAAASPAARPQTGQLTGNTTSLYNTAPAATPTPSGGPQWSSWGKLRRTTFKVDGRPVFVLESAQGQPLLYAGTFANFTLDPYVGQLVCLWGQIGYRSEESFRNNLMTVSQVAVPKDNKK
jgi:uncharacterized protein YgiM (DUF1202 family)